MADWFYRQSDSLFPAIDKLDGRDETNELANLGQESDDAEAVIGSKV